MTQTLPDNRVTDIATAKRDAHRRNEYIEGLRALARALEQHPELELPHTGTGSYVTVIPYGPDEQRQQLAAWASAMPGKKDKAASDNGQYYLIGAFRGLRVKLICERADVCTRVVTGTTEVTTEVKDPEALAAVPTITVTEVVEQVEWRCHPVLNVEREREQPAAVTA
jgi:hypothetical protein